MKKIVKKILVIFMIILIIEIIAYLCKTNHTIIYKINNKKYDYSVEEIYKDNNYYFNIKIDDNKFMFQYSNEFNKSKKVIKDIEYYEDNDLSCIFPILDDDHYLNIICLKDDELYYYDYVKEEVVHFKKQLIAKGYFVDAWGEEETTKKLGNSKIYTDNIDKDTYIYIWKYNGFYTINSQSVQQLNLFNKDTYLNKLGIQIDKYYILPDYDVDYEYDKLYVLNMKSNNIKTIKLKDSISSDYYNNGIVDNKLYLFDNDNLIQYKINPKRNRYEIIGNKDDGGLYYKNGEWETINIYDFKNKELTFIDEEEIPEELNEYNVIYNYQNNYYYFDDNDYIVYDSILKSKTYLFNISSVNDQKFIDNDLYFIKDNTLYYYNIYNGLKKIMEYEEFSFNKVNRYAVYKK